MDPFTWGGYAGYEGFEGNGFYGQPGWIPEGGGYGGGYPGGNDGMGDWGYGDADEVDFSDPFPGAGHGGARDGQGRRSGDPLGMRYEDYGGYGDYGNYGDYSTIGDDAFIVPRRRRGGSRSRDYTMSGALPSEDDPGWVSARDARRAELLRPEPGYAPGDVGDRLDGGFSRMLDRHDRDLYYDELEEPRDGRYPDPFPNDFYGVQEARPPRNRLSRNRDRDGDRQRRVRFADDGGVGSLRSGARALGGRLGDLFGGRERRPSRENRSGGRERRSDRQRRPYGFPYEETPWEDEEDDMYYDYGGPFDGYGWGGGWW